MTDHETRAAVDALIHRLRNRDPGTDDEPFALEYVTALRSRGWRPTEARVQPAWKLPTGHGVDPTEDYRAARRELDERLAGGGDAA